MVFRRDNNRVDSFQRQMSSLRQQIGSDEIDDAELEPEPRDRQAPAGERQRQRPADDDGYSFGSFPSSGVGAGGGGDDEPFEDAFPPEIPEMPSADQQVSVVSAGTTWKGDLESQGSIHVYGTVNGSLKATEDVWVARGAEVDATIEAERVVIAGTVAGSVTARSRFEALPDGELLADVNAPTFIVHEGATINGSLSMTGREARGAEARDRNNRSASIIQRRNRPSS